MLNAIAALKKKGSAAYSGKSLKLFAGMAKNVTTMKELLKDKFLIALFAAIILSLLFCACASTRPGSMGAGDMPVSRHRFGPFGGLHDAGLYIVESQEYGLFFLKVRRFYQPGDSRFIAWQPQPGMEMDKVSFFGSMEWLKRDSTVQIFKINHSWKGQPLPAY